MKLRPLLLIVAGLAVIAGVVHFATRPTPPPAADERVGRPLVDTAVIEKATRLRLAEGGRSVELVKGTDGSWQVASYHDLPADFAKLSRFIGDLTKAKLERLVTRNPDSINRLEFKDTQITLLDSTGAEVWALNLGKNADGGGRFVRFGQENAAFLSRLSTWLDLEPKNWADSALVAVKTDEIAKIELRYPDATPVTLVRKAAGEPFAAEGVAERTVKSVTATSLLGTLTGLRFTDITPPEDADAVAARAAQRTFVLTTFSGRTVTVAVGRRPEATKVIEPTPAAKPTDLLADATKAAPAADLLKPTTETVPAGPVFAYITDSVAGSPGQVVSTKRAPKVADYAFTSLPGSIEDLFETPAARSN